MSNPTRFTSGVSTVTPGKALGNYPFPDPFHTGSALIGNTKYENDFTTLPTGEFTRTTVGTGTFALGNEAGGIAVLTTTAGAADSETVLKAGLGFALVAGQKAWFASRIKLSDATTCIARIGLQNAATPTEGLYFEKVSASTDVTLKSMIASTPTTLASGKITAANATYLEVAYYYDGAEIFVYLDNAVVARVTPTALSTALLTPVITITNGSAVARTLTADYVLASCEIVR